jgi:hypothetical protein
MTGALVRVARSRTPGADKEANWLPTPRGQRAIGNSGINPILRNLDRRAAERPQF